MTKRRKRRSAKFKFDVALEAAKGLQTASQIASEREVHPNQISQWKKQLLEEGASIFSKKTSLLEEYPSGAKEKNKRNEKRSYTRRVPLRGMNKSDA